MKRAVLLLTVIVLWFWLSTLKAQAPYYLVEITQQNSVSFNGLEFFELRFADGSAATVSVDKRVPFAEALRGAQGRHELRLEPHYLRRIER